MARRTRAPPGRSRHAHPLQPAAGGRLSPVCGKIVSHRQQEWHSSGIGDSCRHARICDGRSSSWGHVRSKRTPSVWRDGILPERSIDGIDGVSPGGVHAPRHFQCCRAVQAQTATTCCLPRAHVTSAAAGGGFQLLCHSRPRQTGKTTSMIELAQQLTASGDYVAALVSVEVGAAFNDNPHGGTGDPERLAAGDGTAQLPSDLQPPVWPQAEPERRIGSALQAWARAAPRSLVVFVDEIDALQTDR